LWGSGLVVERSVVEQRRQRIGLPVEQAQCVRGLLFGERLDPFTELLFRGHHRKP
jgi:hypothetical protein